MEFNLAAHEKLYAISNWEHGEKCLCRRFKDGEPMWAPEERKEPKPVTARDPSQSEQSWHEPRTEEREMEKLFD